MFFLIRFSIYFTISFIILSIPINNSSLFEQIHQTTGPFTDDFVSMITNRVERTKDDLKEVGKKAFSNTSPKHQDSVQSRLSSSTKDEILEKAQDDYTVEERESLLRVLKEKAQ